jgi:hypothetical protein
VGLAQIILSCCVCWLRVSHELESLDLGARARVLDVGRLFEDRSPGGCGAQPFDLCRETVALVVR